MHLLGAGAGLAVVAGVEYAAAAAVYRTYQERVTAVEADPTLGAAYANDYFDAEVRPARTRLWATGAGAAVLLTTGLVVRGSF